jgi:UrcA family protein
MNKKLAVSNTRSFICIIAASYVYVAAASAGAVFLAPTQANAKDVTVEFSVSAAGLDLSQPAGARELYRRLKNAARIVCTHGMRVNLEPATSFSDCYEKALGEAVRSTHRPQLTVVYLSAHTPVDAAKYGIEVPVQLAAE